MKDYQFLTSPALIACLFFMITNCQNTKSTEQGATTEKPNVIIIYNDDLGYGDLSSYGAKNIKTPYIDQLAEEGLKLTNFYVASSVCSPSRAALLTGAYPMRVGIPHVLAPQGISWAGERWRLGLHPEESTLPELLKKQGYATAILGKWHLGHLPEHLPGQHGFDYFYGIPYSNDMRPATDKKYPPLPMIENNKIVEEGLDQTQFTKTFADKAIQFMEQQVDQPFFVYLANPMPHVPLYASDIYKGKSAGGLYGDVIEEIDGAVGEIIAFLEERDLRENTIIVFTSDNGPWLSYGNHAGSAGNLREGKSTSMEGGQKVPFIISWPNKIPSRASDALVTNMDIMPTLLAWAGAELPDKVIDGIAMNAFFEGQTTDAGREEMLYYLGEELQAMRKGKWKLHQPHQYQKIGDGVGMDGVRGTYDEGQIGWALYDLKADPGETNDLAEKRPEIVKEMRQEMLAADSLLKQQVRPPSIFEGKRPPVGKLW